MKTDQSHFKKVYFGSELRVQCIMEGQGTRLSGAGRSVAPVRDREVDSGAQFALSF